MHISRAYRNILCYLVLAFVGPTNDIANAFLGLPYVDITGKPECQSEICSSYVEGSERCCYHSLSYLEDNFTLSYHCFMQCEMNIMCSIQWLIWKCNMICNMWYGLCGFPALCDMRSGRPHILSEFLCLLCRIWGCYLWVIRIVICIMYPNMYHYVSSYQSLQMQ